MLYGVFTRGTTPTHVFPLPKQINHSDLKNYTICYRQKKNNVLTKQKKDTIHVEELDFEKNIVIMLSQEDTLLFDPRVQIVDVQIKAIDNSGKVFIVGSYRFRLEDSFDQSEFDQ